MAEVDNIIRCEGCRLTSLDKEWEKTRLAWLLQYVDIYQLEMLQSNVLDNDFASFTDFCGVLIFKKIINRVQCSAFISNDILLKKKVYIVWSVERSCRVEFLLRPSLRWMTQTRRWFNGVWLLGIFAKHF